MRSRAIWSGVAIAAVAAIVWSLRSEPQPESIEAAALTMPTLSGAEKTGQRLFGETCAACHGETAGGTDQGPPLIHRIYEPSHHGDAAFHLAVQNGVRAHHWRYGEMMPPGVV